MSIAIVLSNVGVSVCFLLGLIAVFKPQYTKSFVGINASSPEGESEIRATYGGFFIGLSICAFVLQSSEVFSVIGFAWMAAAFIRLLTIFMGSYSAKNVGGVVFEAIVGTLCLSAMII